MPNKFCLPCQLHKAYRIKDPFMRSMTVEHVIAVYRHKRDVATTKWILLGLAVFISMLLASVFLAPKG